MDESKIELTERLRREGRWPEASRYKDDMVTRLRTEEGLKGAAARERAWELTAEKYPPLPSPESSCADAPEQPGVEGSGLESLEACAGDAPPDLARDTLWAYEHLADKQTRPEGAPSAGAWSLLLWAREYRNRFFEQLVPKAMAARPSHQEIADEAVQSDPAIQKVRQLLLDFRRQAEENLAKNVPPAIRRKVSTSLREWSMEHDVTISVEADEGLQLRMVGIAKECMMAVLAHPERFADLRDERGRLGK